MDDNFEISHYRDGIDFITIKNNDLKVTLSTFGAGVYSLYFKDEPLVMELKDKEDYIKNAQFFGKTLGVVAGRIPSFIEVDGSRHHLLEDGEFPFSLHGGKLNSLSFKNFRYEIKDYSGRIDVIFKISPRKNENGFPGKCNIKIIYSLNKFKNSLKIKFKGSFKETSLLNLSNHIYWNLNRSKDVNDYYLNFNAPQIGKNREDLLIVGKIDTPEYLDFKKSRKLKPCLDKASKTCMKTIDNTFIFANEGKLNEVILQNKEYQIKMKTNYEAMNIYVDSSLTPLSFANRDDFLERRAIALEPQKFVLDLENITYRKNDKYDYSIEYLIKRR